MTQIVADLQLHSKYSRAVSKDMVVPVMARWGKKKGIDLLATGDWMHTLWLRELQSQLIEVSEGIFELKDSILDGKIDNTKTQKGTENAEEKTKFLLSAEISSIYSEGGKGRRVHTLVFVPSFAAAEKINEKLLARGCNLLSDGRPIVGLSCKEIAEIVFSVEERALVIPAHAWTPWFALYGSKSGFDSVEECFGDLSKRIYAIETGLSSDPGMNWKVADLKRRAIVSFSDAHSPVKLGREATVFVFKDEILRQSGASHSARSAQDDSLALKSLASESNETGQRKFTYDDIYGAITERFTGKNEGKLKIGYTIEFYPEEGKYHWTGHRACHVKQSPEETRKLGTTCPVCGRGLTVGVEHRVEQLTNDQLIGLNSEKKTNKNGVVFNYHPKDSTRPPYVMLVPLYEILAEVFEVGVASKQVVGAYENLLERFGSEFEVLLRTPIEKIAGTFGKRLAEAIKKVREQDIAVEPGYDGEFGKVAIWPVEAKASEGEGKQMGLF
ncbi:MAG: DNA helicase UvrD [Candidatus Chisholmbacteria bacterium]|nr:DNA helicase UvrD [Candidatus Chisholmbacteria bacterium]